MVAVIVSTTILFVRGFRLRDLSRQFNYQTLETPAIKVWLLEMDGFQDKMTAYKKGISAGNDGLGVYIITTNNQWKWVASVYTNENEAKNVLKSSKSLSEANCNLYEIKSKSFQIPKETTSSCRQVLSTVQNIFDLLVQLRTAFLSFNNIDNLIFDITQLYNDLKITTEKLQGFNTEYKSEIIATLIYTANQNILSLQDVIYGNKDKHCSLATLNTVLLNVIFSLDNF